MRSFLVYSAGVRIQNRFLLATVTMRAVRRLHIAATRTEDTANRVLTEVASGKYLEVGLPELKPLPPIGIPLTAPAA